MNFLVETELARIMFYDIKNDAKLRIEYRTKYGRYFFFDVRVPFTYVFRFPQLPTGLGSDGHFRK